MSRRHFLDFLDPDKMSVIEVTFSLTKSVFHQRVLVTVAERFLKKSLDHGEQNSPFPMVERFLKKPLDHGEQNILNPGKNREVSFSRSPGFRIFYSPWPSGFFKNRSAIGLQNILFPMAERFFQKPLGHGMHNTR